MKQHYHQYISALTHPADASLGDPLSAARIEGWEKLNILGEPWYNFFYYPDSELNTPNSKLIPCPTGSIIIINAALILFNGAV